MTALTKKKEIHKVSTSNSNNKGRPTVLTDVGPYDVMCGRHKSAFNNVGNRRFRVTINLNLPRYVEARPRHEKSAVIKSVVKFLQDEVGVRFLKPKGKGFIELNDTQTRSKVGHALRDMLLAQQNCTIKELSEGGGPNSTGRSSISSNSKPAPTEGDKNGDLQESPEGMMVFCVDGKDENDSFDPFLFVPTPHSTRIKAKEDDRRDDTDDDASWWDHTLPLHMREWPRLKKAKQQSGFDDSDDSSLDSLSFNRSQSKSMKDSTLDPVFLHTPPSPRSEANYQHGNDDSLPLDPPLSIGNETIKQHSLEPRDLKQWFLPSSRAHITAEKEGDRDDLPHPRPRAVLHTPPPTSPEQEYGVLHDLLSSISPLPVFIAHPEQAAPSTLAKRKKLQGHACRSLALRVFVGEKISVEATALMY
jgi:hypothetical protein